MTDKTWAIKYDLLLDETASSDELSVMSSLSWVLGVTIILVYLYVVSSTVIAAKKRDGEKMLIGVISFFILTIGIGYALRYKGAI